eukprot:COSAG01_NODE_12327_length_1758_cov_24.517179_4_plen_51_part_01
MASILEMTWEAKHSPPRNMSSIVMEAPAEELLSDIKQFYASRKWYHLRVTS